MRLQKWHLTVMQEYSNNTMEGFSMIQCLDSNTMEGLYLTIHNNTMGDLGHIMIHDSSSMIGLCQMLPQLHNSNSLVELCHRTYNKEVLLAQCHHPTSTKEVLYQFLTQCHHPTSTTKAGQYQVLIVEGPYKLLTQCHHPTSTKEVLYQFLTQCHHPTTSTTKAVQLIREGPYKLLTQCHLTIISLHQYHHSTSLLQHSQDKHVSCLTLLVLKNVNKYKEKHLGWTTIPL